MAALTIEKTRVPTLEEDIQTLRELLYENYDLARDYLPEVRDRHGDVPELAYWNRIMSPPAVRRLKSQTPGRDMIREFNWIKANAHRYYGQYLAIYEDELLAHGNDLEAVLAKGRAKSPRPDFLLFHAVGMPS